MVNLLKNTLNQSSPGEKMINRTRRIKQNQSNTKNRKPNYMHPRPKQTSKRNQEGRSSSSQKNPNRMRHRSNRLIILMQLLYNI